MSCKKLAYYQYKNLSLRVVDKNPTLFQEQVAAGKSHQKGSIDYYPFGSPMPGRTFNPTEYRFGFGNKEKDDEIKGSGNSYDFEARFYDPRVGRFLSIDPLSEEQPGWSTYKAFLDNPIYWQDPDGRTEKRLGPNENPGSHRTASPKSPPSTPNPYGTKLSISNSGLIENKFVTVKRIANLEKGNLNSVEGIILHRTVSSNSQSPLTSFENTGVGTHFLVGKEGTIFQTASLNKKTSHLRESQLTSWAPKNNSAIGIEVVGMYNAGTKVWDPLTPAQVQSTAFLTNSLLFTYNLQKANIYSHEDIQPKTAGEGKTVRNAIENYLPEPATPTPSPSQGDDLHYR